MAGAHGITVHPRYFESFYDLPVDDFESLVKGLWERYETIISEGRFSRGETAHGKFLMRPNSLN